MSRYDEESWYYVDFIKFDWLWFVLLIIVGIWFIVLLIILIVLGVWGVLLVFVLVCKLDGFFSFFLDDYIWWFWLSFFDIIFKV